jgi:hypothetical protein
MLALSCAPPEEGMEEPIAVDPKATRPTGSPPAPSAPQEQADYQVDGALSLESKEIDQHLRQFKAKLSQLNGRVISEQVSGSGSLSSANLVVRVPHGNFDELYEYTKTLGEVVSQTLSRRSVADDFDQPLQPHDQREPLRKSAAQEAQMKVQFHTPYTQKRLRKTAGVHYYYLHPVSVREREGDALQKMPSGSGAAVSLVSRERSVSFDIASIHSDGEDNTGMMSVGFGEFLNMPSGTVSFLNSWYAVRLGVLTREGMANWLIALEAGVEILRTNHLIIEASVRPGLMIGQDRSGTVVSSTLGMSMQL